MRNYNEQRKLQIIETIQSSFAMERSACISNAVGAWNVRKTLSTRLWIASCIGQSFQCNHTHLWIKSSSKMRGRFTLKGLPITEVRNLLVLAIFALSRFFSHSFVLPLRSHVVGFLAILEQFSHRGSAQAQSAYLSEAWPATRPHWS